jgi:hypothetical protein
LNDTIIRHSSLQSSRSGGEWEWAQGSNNLVVTCKLPKCAGQVLFVAVVCLWKSSKIICLARSVPELDYMKKSQVFDFKKSLAPAKVVTK